MFYKFLCTATPVHKPVQSVHNYRIFNAFAQKPLCGKLLYAGCIYTAGLKLQVSIIKIFLHK